MHARRPRRNLHLGRAEVATTSRSSSSTSCTGWPVATIAAPRNASSLQRLGPVPHHLRTNRS